MMQIFENVSHDTAIKVLKKLALAMAILVLSNVAFLAMFALKCW